MTPVFNPVFGNPNPPGGAGIGRVEWDERGERVFRSGLDRGMLYPRNAPGVPWNGLISVSEGETREVTSHYSDGVKHLERELLGEFKGQITAFTYPDEFEAVLGRAEFLPFAGMFVHDQPSQLFGMSYRVMIGDDIAGPDAAYEIHMLWNLRALANDRNRSTRTNQAEADTFSWTVTSTPMTMFGAHPTAHVSIDSRLMNAEQLSDLEDILYGTAIYAPALPVIVDDPPVDS